jgi:hypothetical protein
MKQIVMILLSVLLLIMSCNAEEKELKKAPSSNDNDIMKVETHFGKYYITGYEKYGGGITTDEYANNLINTEVIISEKLFKIRDKEIKNPKYKTSIYNVPQEEGNIDPRDLSIFYGFEADRKIIYKLSVFDPEDAEPHPYMTLEILEIGKYLDMHDGRFYFINKEKAKKSSGTSSED